MIHRLEALLDARLALLPHAPRAAAVLARDAPGGLAAPGLISANRHCRLLRAADGWVALNLARDEDFDVLPALAGGSDWAAVERAAAGETAVRFRDRASELQLPVAMPGEAAPAPLPVATGTAVRRVVDLSALWAGPLCAGLLAGAGAEVVRIESRSRPDPTPLASPLLDARLNGAKRRLPLDLTTPEGRAHLLDEVARADVLVTSARAPALARLGLEPAALLAAHPQLRWVAITAHGFTGAGAGRVGFGDDCAVAGGLVRREAGEPRFLGDALADPLTGVEAALAVLRAEAGGLIDMAMARIAAGYAAALA